jgi:hypothetical protein
MEQALEIALAIDSPIAGTIVNNLAAYASLAGDFARTDELYGEAARLAERYGDASSIRFIRGNQIWMDFMLGRWDRALESADAFIAECESGSRHTLETVSAEFARRSPSHAATVTARSSSRSASSSCRRHAPTRTIVSAR